MSFNINKYKQKKKRNCFDFLRYKYLKHKRYCRVQYQKYDKERQYKENLHEKLKSPQDKNDKSIWECLKASSLKDWLIYFLGAAGFYSIFFLLEKINFEPVLNILCVVGILLLQGIGWLIGIVVFCFIISTIYKIFFELLSTFIANLLDAIDMKRQVSISKNIKQEVERALDDITVWKERTIEEIQKELLIFKQRIYIYEKNY